MNELQREGNFIATLVSHKVAQTGKNQLLTLIVDYKVTAAYVDEKWVNMPDNPTITGWHYLQKKDGNVNESTLKQLREAIEWDGRLESLSDAQGWYPPVIITVGAEVWEGETRYKVKWLQTSANAIPETGGIKPIAPDKLKALAAAFDSKARAILGPAPARRTAPPPQPTPAPPPDKTDPVSAAPPPNDVPF